MWIRTTSDGVTNRTSAEKELTESPVTRKGKGKIAPTLKDTRSAEPAGRPQQATSAETPGQTAALSTHRPTSTVSASPFDPAAHQRLIRNIPCTETPAPDPVLSPAALAFTKQLWNDSDEESEDEMTSSTPKEIRLNNPKTFNGDRNNLNKFIQSCKAYLKLNEAIFNSDKKKILFALSYMTEGTAEAWKEVFMDEKNRTYGSHTDFITELKKAFSMADAEGEAQAELRQLRQGKDIADKYITQFRIFAGRTKVTDDKQLIECFMEGINTGILQKIFGQNPLPTMIGEWYNSATKFDSQHRRFQEILGQRKGPAGFQTQTKKTNIPRFARSYWNDPDAMDMDRLTTEE